jgi:hypothetical protein
MLAPYRLDQMILQHWRQHRPQMVLELEQSGQLQKALQQTSKDTASLLFNLMQVQKLDYPAAWEMATAEWAFLPTEDRRANPT